MRWSRAAVRVHHHAPPRQAPERFADDIAALLCTLDPVLVVPSCEEVFHLAAPGLAALLGKRLFAPPLPVLHRLHAKHLFAGLCAGLGLHVPETHCLRDAVALHRFAPAAADWVFKPAYSRFGVQALVGPEPERLRTLAPSPEAPWVAQRRVRGTELSFYAVARAGTVRAFAAYDAPWRLPGGASYAFRPVAPDVAAGLRVAAEAIAGALHLTGQFACDAIRDADGRTWLIECNPRATSGVHLLAGGGAVARAMLDDDAPLSAAAPTPRHNLPMMLSYGVSEAARTGRWAEWRRTLRDGHDVVGRPGDWLPLGGALADTALFARTARRHGLPLAAATTFDIEWNGEPLP